MLKLSGGKFFDILLILAISLGFLVVMLNTISSLNATYGEILKTAEWIFTILFTFEYIIRIVVAKNPKKYIFSFLRNTLAML